MSLFRIENLHDISLRIAVGQLENIGPSGKTFPGTWIG